MVDSRKSVIEQIIEFVSIPGVNDFQSDFDFEMNMLLFRIVWYWLELTLSIAHFRTPTKKQRVDRPPPMSLEEKVSLVNTKLIAGKFSLSSHEPMLREKIYYLFWPGEAFNSADENRTNHILLLPLLFWLCIYFASACLFRPAFAPFEVFCASQCAQMLKIWKMTATDVGPGKIKSWLRTH